MGSFPQLKLSLTLAYSQVQRRLGPLVLMKTFTSFEKDGRMTPATDRDIPET